VSQREFITHRGGRPNPTPYTGSRRPLDDSRAACKGADLEIFFPLRSNALATEAKAYCRECPIRRDCLNWALAMGDTFAVLGGLTPAERRRLRTHRPAPASAPAGYTVCAADGCTVEFRANSKQPDRRYCSRGCSNRARAGLPALEAVA
jgi:WhiB family redox-sensing transcriptional regulator